MDPANIAYSATFVPLGQPVRLGMTSSGRRDLMLDIVYSFGVKAEQTARIGNTLLIEPTAYDYQILDALGTELLVYHWQPGPDYDGPDHLYLHVSSALTVQMDANRECRSVDLDKLHPPTGLITLSSIIRLLISEFRVTPLRADWQIRLLSAESSLRALPILRA
jgi:hypothetical protein